MDEIKVFLRMMTKEELVSLCAAMMFQMLVNATDLAKSINDLEKVKKSITG